MLEQAGRQGMISDYRGIRISKTGKRFVIHRATVWNVLDRSEKICGQAATFSDWSWLSGESPAPDAHCIP